MTVHGLSEDNTTTTSRVVGAVTGGGQQVLTIDTQGRPVFFKDCEPAVPLDIRIIYITKIWVFQPPKKPDTTLVCWSNQCIELQAVPNVSKKLNIFKL